VGLHLDGGLCDWDGQKVDRALGSIEDRVYGQGHTRFIVSVCVQLHVNLCCLIKCLYELALSVCSKVGGKVSLEHYITKIRNSGHLSQSC